MTLFRFADGNPASPSQARSAVLLGWLVLSVIGVFAITQHWMAQGDLREGVARALLYEGIISCVCIAGYLLHSRQSFVGLQAIADQPPTTYIATDFRSALRDGLLFQLPILVLTALLLDGGRVFHVTKVAACAYWPMAALIYFNRRASPTYVDLIAIRYGYIVILLVVGKLGPALWTKLGLW
jgi:hypothetical protein